MTAVGLREERVLVVVTATAVALAEAGQPYVTSRHLR
jgi:hypothetical protein